MPTDVPFIRVRHKEHGGETDIPLATYDAGSEDDAKSRGWEPVDKDAAKTVKAAVAAKKES